MARKGLNVLTLEDDFRFDCHDGLKCFTQCCRDVTIFLTPYDILRLRKALGMASHEFLQTYTLTVMGKNGLPFVLLKMQDDYRKSCPFVSDNGCRVYPDRPWTCRVYPLQPEQTKQTKKSGKQYYSVMDVPFCLGLRETRTASVTDWLEKQGAPIYMEMEEQLNTITTSEFLSDKQIKNKKIQDMFFMAAYDLDRFRRFVFESSFLSQFETDANEVEKIRHDDVALYAFAMRWLEFGFIGQDGFKLKPTVMAAQKEKMGTQ